MSSTVIVRDTLFMFLYPISIIDISIIYYAWYTTKKNNEIPSHSGLCSNGYCHKMVRRNKIIPVVAVEYHSFSGQCILRANQANWNGEKTQRTSVQPKNLILWLVKCFILQTRPNQSVCISVLNWHDRKMN